MWPISFEALPPLDLKMTTYVVCRASEPTQHHDCRSDYSSTSTTFLYYCIQSKAWTITLNYFRGEGEDKMGALVIF